MNTKTTLSALCLCLMAGSADAAIINYISSVDIRAYAGSTSLVHYDAAGNPYPYFDQHQIVSTYTTSHSDTDTVSAVFDDWAIIGDTTYYASADAWSSSTTTADLAGGLFSMTGAYDSFSTGWLRGISSNYVEMMAWVTTPYLYTLDIVASAGTYGSIQALGVYLQDLSNGVSLHTSGMLNPGVGFNMYAATSGCSDGTCYGVPSGNYQITLTLTPTAVPVPAAAWLFGSGLLGLMGMARRNAATT